MIKVNREESVKLSRKAISKFLPSFLSTVRFVARVGGERMHIRQVGFFLYGSP